MNQATAKPATLTAEQLAMIEELEREEKAARRYRKHAAKARRLREQLEAIFGEARVAVFTAKKPADQRAFLRTVDERDYEPLPAKTVRIVKFHEIPPWDA